MTDGTRGMRRRLARIADAIEAGRADGFTLRVAGRDVDCAGFAPLALAPGEGVGDALEFDRSGAVTVTRRSGATLSVPAAMVEGAWTEAGALPEPPRGAAVEDPMSGLGRTRLWEALNAGDVATMAATVAARTGLGDAGRSVVEAVLREGMRGPGDDPNPRSLFRDAARRFDASKTSQAILSLAEVAPGRAGRDMRDLLDRDRLWSTANPAVAALAAFADAM